MKKENRIIFFMFLSIIFTSLVYANDDITNKQPENISEFRKYVLERGFIEDNENKYIDLLIRNSYIEAYGETVNGMSYSTQIDGIGYFFIFYNTDINKTNFAVLTAYKENKYTFYKINQKLEKGKIEEWFDDNKDGIRQKEEVFYLWY